MIDQLCSTFFRELMSKIEKKRIPKESPTRHIENVAGFTLV
jgi:hypothetical protein